MSTKKPYIKMSILRALFAVFGWLGSFCLIAFAIAGGVGNPWSNALGIAAGLLFAATLIVAIIQATIFVRKAFES